MVYIWVRKPVDWDDAGEVERLLHPRVRAKVALWDATFDIPFARFRSRVAEIARRNHARVEGAVRAEWDEIPDGALVLPVDDDDWFAPGAARALEQYRRPEVSLYYWTARWIEVPIDLRHYLSFALHALLPRRYPGWTCSTNNYAMVKGPGVKEPLESHVVASAWADEQLQHGGEKVKAIEGELGIANRHLASMTTLRHHSDEIPRWALMLKYHRYRRLYKRPLPTHLDWARPHVAQMAELMAQLRVRPS